ncbi:MAG: hypothetical protein LKJ76_07080 [Lachnospiraceae bacterium]|jgi:hypothetical protein|nr:hypothetical protein [Lachnospiraceae bacterium]
MSIERDSLFRINYYRYGEAYFGSDRGMRFRIAREPLEDIIHNKPSDAKKIVLLATVWPEPLCFAAAGENSKESVEFDFSEEGLDAAYEWLCRKREEEEARWSAAAEAGIDVKGDLTE